MKFYSNIIKCLVAILLMCPDFASARLLMAGKSLFDVPIYESLTLEENKTFTVIGRITVQAEKRDDLLKLMQTAAKRHDGEAVLAYKVVETGEVPAVTVGSATAVTSVTSGETMITHTRSTPGTTQVIGVGGFALPTAEGIVIKFDKDGIGAITADTPVPVLN